MSSPRSKAEQHAARAHELALERAALDEVAAQLGAEERALGAELAAASEEMRELDTRLGEAKARSRALDAEIFAAEDTKAALDLELDNARRRAERASLLATQLERELCAYQRQIEAAKSGVEEILGSMVRIKHKLHHAADIAALDSAAPTFQPDEENVEAGD